MNDKDLQELASQECQGGDCGWPPGVVCQPCWAYAKLKQRGIKIRTYGKEFRHETNLLGLYGEPTNGITPMFTVDLPPKTKIEVIIREIIE